MKNFIQILIAIVIIFAAGFAVRHFFFEKEAEITETVIPDYNSMWKTEKDSLFELITQLKNQEPIKELVWDPEQQQKMNDLLKQNSNLQEQLENNENILDFMEEPQYVYLMPKGKNVFERYFSFTPKDFPKALSTGDSIWADVNAYIESDLVTNEKGEILAKNMAKCQISNIKMVYRDRSEPDARWQAIIEADFLKSVNKNFVLGLGGGVYYKPWDIGIKAKAGSDKTFGAGINKHFDLKLK